MIYCPKCRKLVPENLIIDKVISKDAGFYDVYIESCCSKCGQTISNKMTISGINEVIIPEE